MSLNVIHPNALFFISFKAPVLMALSFSFKEYLKNTFKKSGQASFPIYLAHFTQGLSICDISILNLKESFNWTPVEFQS